MQASSWQLESRYEALAKRQQFVCAHGLESWPDGTVAARYRFIHALYQEVIYAQVSPGRCASFHQRIGARKEAGYGGQAGDIASELATHFIHGHDTQRAVHYLHVAGEQALRRSAYHEARTHLAQGIELLPTLPENREQMQLEIDLQSALGNGIERDPRDNLPRS